ncbi:DUF262 domain-containing protein [Demetria terragena]|uniref:DUF262 domain-containing protein n=1 Tax=Demetria terragena TaxID=63959 RepID=UPI00035F85EB|nr:DUF262 domain-containing protein [Demetria terragena]
MINSAEQYPVHALLSPDTDVSYRVPPYQREYSWRRSEWEALFDDLVNADGAHFLGTIIILDRTRDSLQRTVEVIDGQQRLTTLSILLAATHSVLDEHREGLDAENAFNLLNLSRQLVRGTTRQPRVTPQRQGQNLDDFCTVLADAGLEVDAHRQRHHGNRRIAKCYRYFSSAIEQFAADQELTPASAAERIRFAATRAILVKIEVPSSADAFVLFESLNNRGVPLSPVDLIKNHLLAESERRAVMNVEEAFERWNTMLTNLGDAYATHERFLRHYYNAFKTDLPEVRNASVATRSNLIRIYEGVLSDALEVRLESLASASADYGRISCITERDDPAPLDQAFQRLIRAQGTPSYVLVLWLMSRRETLELTESHLSEVVDVLTSFFVRRNLTGYPQTYGLAKLFMTTIEKMGDARSDGVVRQIKSNLLAVSSSDELFRERLQGRIYEENVDVTRFILTTLAEDGMTRETSVDLWAQDSNGYVWTIEHILPQGSNLPRSWQDMLGGEATAAIVQEEHKHRLGNLTITAYNSNLGNKSFQQKRDRQDSNGRNIGYRNGLSLNSELIVLDCWGAEDIDSRTLRLAEQVLRRFPLPA